MATALTPTNQVPQYDRQQIRVATVAAGSDAEQAAARAPFVGTVAVSFIPDTVLTGANTESRTLSAINKGSSGSLGTTEVCSTAFVSGTNAAAMRETTLTASAVSGAIDVAEGDLISFKSTHVGSTGLAQPPGLVIVLFTRA